MGWQREHHRSWQPGTLSGKLLRLIAIAACFAAATAVRSAIGQDVINREPALKAAFLVKFAKYITWPTGSFADERAPLVIGMLGNSDVARPLEEIGKRRLVVQNRPVAVQLATRPSELVACHIVYLPAILSPQQRAEALRVIQGRHVLSVGEDAAFLTDGGLLRFTVENNRLGGAINLKAVHREQLQVSSELLTIFKPVD